jgi:hypothetical protein
VLKPDVNEIDQLSVLFTNFFKQNTSLVMEKIEITKEELFGQSKFKKIANDKKKNL